MKAALVVPPVRDFYFTPQRAAFLGVRTLAMLLKERGVPHAVINGVRQRGRREPLPGSLAHLSPHVGKKNFFGNFYRFGVTEDNLAVQVRDYGADIVFITSIAFCYAEEAMRTADACKALMPGIPVVVGGPGPSVYPGYYLRNCAADFAVTGEAEHFMEGFPGDLRSAPGVWYREGDILKHTEAPETPCSFRPVLVPLHESADTAYYSTMITRGCPKRCSFCPVWRQFPGFRKAAADDIGEMCSPLMGSAKKVHINFEDDNVTLDFPWFHNVLETVRRCTGGNFSFSMENGSSFAVLDEEKVRVLKEYNVRQMNLSLISANPDILAENRREKGTGAFEEAVRLLDRHGIPVVAYLIAGLKGETRASVMEGVRFLERLPVLIGISAYYPVPGIEGYEDRSFFDAIPPRQCAGSAFMPWHDIDTPDLVDIFIASRRINLGKQNMSSLNIS
ncbi:MAG TPA: radical SAM protein [Spirochaetota bacterium]|nr:radical SAM protein [Spirochaetota bacterium]